MRSPSRPDQAAPVAPDPIPPVSDMVQVPLCIDEDDLDRKDPKEAS